jgi:NAD-dependent dihydropyrimidine dehydrogenase PreA subunit
MIDKLLFRAVGHCPCRQIMRYNGKGCDHSLENCLHFGSMGRHMVAQGMAREISTEETLKIVYEADQEGLVHVCENIDGHLGTICNCCGCCCAFLGTNKMMGLKTFAPSNYVARVDQELCAGCGICEERCPMEAAALESDTATVNEANCIGCGVCKATCSTEAIGLVQRDSVNPPPDLNKFFEARYKM